MSVLKWDTVGERLYEVGVEKGVLYPQAVDGSYPKGVAWNGLSAVNESPSGAEPTAVWANNKKYLNLYSAEEYKATIEAYTYPEEFEACDGSAEIVAGSGIYLGQQPRQSFGFSYKTNIGSDTEGEKHGYKIHLVYGCTASPTDKSHETMNDSPDVNPMSWEVDAIPVDVPGFAKPTATLTVDSTKVKPAVLAKIEEALYGTESEEAYLPSPAEIIEMISSAA